MTRNQLYQEYQAPEQQNLVRFLPDYNSLGDDLEVLAPDDAFSLLCECITVAEALAKEGHLDRHDPCIEELKYTVAGMRDLIDGQYDELYRDHPKYTAAVRDWAAEEAERQGLGESNLDLIDVLDKMGREMQNDGEEEALLLVVATARRRQVLRELASAVDELTQPTLDATDLRLAA